MGQKLTRTPKIQLISISASHLLVHFISVTALQKYDVEFPDKTEKVDTRSPIFLSLSEHGCGFDNSPTDEFGHIWHIDLDGIRDNEKAT